MLRVKFYAILLAICGLSACGKDDDADSEFESLKTEVINNYANLVSSNYQDAYDDAVSLKDAIESFTANPDEGKFTAVKEAWLQARESYGITEAFRFAEGPIDIIGNEEGPEGLLNSWPLDESYIDYVAGAETAGIINDLTTYASIDKALLSELNGAGGEENVSIGYHAIEFLLWGQDLTTPADKSAGQRPYTDFVDGGTAANQDRRRTYLNLCCELLLDHLSLLTEQWNLAGGAYRNTFTAMDQDKALGGVMTAIATLSKSELAGERVFVAYDNRDQEDEHSCFSDNTHRDVRLNFNGIKNVYLSILKGQEYSSINDLIALKDQALADEIKAALTDAETKVFATATPFDFAISDDAERPKVLEAVDALRKLGDHIAEGGTAIGIDVGTELD